MAVPTLYNFKFCPFGQRVWMSLLYKGIDFEYIETDPYDKTEQWLAINPRGLVPVIIHNGNKIFESAVLVEYVDEAWPSDIMLLPSDPYLRAHVRLWADHIGKKITPQYYNLLLKRTREEWDKAKAAVLEAVSAIMENMSSEGPFFLGKQFGMVDIMLAPFAQGMSINTKHFRNFDIPDDEKFRRYHTWWKAVKDLPCYQATRPDPEALINIYSKVVMAASDDVAANTLTSMQGQI